MTIHGVQRLAALVGTWHTTGKVAPRPGHSAERFTATDRYEWLPGAQFLVHHWDAEMPDGRTRGIEIIGHEPHTDRFPMHAYDSDGNRTTMIGSCEGKDMKFEGIGIRFTGRLSDDFEQIHGVWEVQPDGADWQELMTVTLTRQA